MKQVIVVLGLCIFAVPAFAGFGIHLNYDLAKIDAEASPAITFAGDPTGSYATLGREETKNLVGGGIDMTFGMIPMIDLMLSVEAAYAKYTSYFSAVYGGVISNEPSTQDLPYLRAGVDLTAMYDVLPIPAVGAVYAGAGPSFMAVAPVFSESLILDNFSSTEDEVDPSSLANDIQMEFGLHLAAGAKLKPSGFPVGFRVGAKYYIIPSLKDPAPKSWLTLQAGITFGG